VDIIGARGMVFVDNLLSSCRKMLLPAVLLLLLPQHIHQYSGFDGPIDCSVDSSSDQYEIGNYTYLSWLSSDYGVAQKIAGHGVKSTARAVQEMISFMSSFGKTDLSLSPCQNRDELCCFWASSGECYRGDTDYMRQSCGPCCKSCLAEDFKIDFSHTENASYAIGLYFEDGDNRVDEESDTLDDTSIGQTEAQNFQSLDYSVLPLLSKSYGVMQLIEEGSTAMAVEQMIQYMNNVVDSLDPEGNDLILAKCKNQNSHCCFWASLGECDNPETEGYMDEFCGPCCMRCTAAYHDFEYQDIDDKELESSIHKLADTSKKFGVEQVLQGNGRSTVKVVQKMIDYMADMVSSVDDSDSYLIKCRNKDELCCFWASVGECDNPETKGYMEEYCSPCCMRCMAADQDLEIQEVEDEDAESAFQLAEASKKFGIEQLIQGGGQSAVEAVQEMIDYMTHMASDMEASDIFLTKCQNKDELCCFWASLGECDKPETKGFMEENCSPCCMRCMATDQDLDTQENEDEDFETLALELSDISKNFGEPQEIVDGEIGTLKAVQKMIDYMVGLTLSMKTSDPDYTKLTECQNEEELCCYWASTGECEKPESKGYMDEHCGPCCNSCAKTPDDDGDDLESLAVQLTERSRDFGVAQKIKDRETGALNAVQEMINFMTSVTLTISTSDSAAVTECQNHDELCCFWASLGDCEDPLSQHYMNENCSPCCLSCTTASLTRQDSEYREDEDL